MCAVDAPQHQIGVSNGWLRPSQPVADRARHRSGAAWPHVQVARRRQPGNAAAARPDGGDVQHRQLYRPVPKLPGQGNCGSEPAEQGNISAGSAHVEGDAVLNTGVPGHINGGHDPGCRAGEGGVDRLLRGGFRAYHASVGLHNQQGGLHSQFPQFPRQVLDVIADAGHYVGVQHRGNRPLVFPEDWEHFGRQGQVRLRELLQDQFPHPEFVGRVSVGMGQGNGDGLDSFVAEMLCRRTYRVFVERGNDSAVKGGAFLDFKDALRGHGAFRLHPDVGVGQAGHAVASDFQNVLESVGYQYSDGCTLALEDGVGGDGGAVKDVTNLRVGHAIGAENLADAGDEATGWVIGSGGSLEQLETAGGEVQEDNVGEGSPHVYSQGVVVHILPTGFLGRCRV